FGQDGPYRLRPAHDVAYQALAGMLFDRGAGAAPSVETGDLAAGMYAAIAILAGLFHREQTGCGVYVDVSMLDVLVSLMTPLLGPVLNRAEAPAFPHEPGYRIYETADGK